MSRDRYERRHRRTAGNPEAVRAMADADFDAAPPLSEAMGLHPTCPTCGGSLGHSAELPCCCPVLDPAAEMDAELAADAAYNQWLDGLNADPPGSGFDPDAEAAAGPEREHFSFFGGGMPS